MLKNRAFSFEAEKSIPTTDSWFDSDQASRYLMIDKKTLLNEVSKGRIPFYKFGRRNRYLKSELDQMILVNARGPLWQ